MLNRRQFIQRSISIPVIAGLAGCTGNEPTGENGDETESPTPTSSTETESSDTETESSTPSPDTEWQRNMPACSSGDYTFKVRGVNINEGSRSVTVSIENTGVEAYELYQVGIEFRNTSGSEWIQEFTDVVLEGGESASFELDTGFGTVEAVLDVSVSVSGESGFETCW